MQSSLAFITRIIAINTGISKISHKLITNPRIVNIPNTAIQGTKGTPNSSAFLKQPL
jgi:hypothetical protein